MWFVIAIIIQYNINEVEWRRKDEKKNLLFKFTLNNLPELMKKKSPTQNAFIIPAVIFIFVIQFEYRVSFFSFTSSCVDLHFVCILGTGIQHLSHSLAIPNMHQWIVSTHYPNTETNQMMFNSLLYSGFFPPLRWIFIFFFHRKRQKSVDFSYFAIKNFSRERKKCT